MDFETKEVMSDRYERRRADERENYKSSRSDESKRREDRYRREHRDHRDRDEQRHLDHRDHTRDSRDERHRHYHRKRQELLNDPSRQKHTSDTADQLNDRIIQEQRATAQSTKRILAVMNSTLDVKNSAMQKLDRQCEQLTKSERQILESDANVKRSREEIRQVEKYGKLFAFSLPSFKKSRERRELVESENQLYEYEKRTFQRDDRREDFEYEELMRSANEKPRKKEHTSEERRVRSMDRYRGRNAEFDRLEDEIENDLGLLSLGLEEMKRDGLRMTQKIASTSGQIDRMANRTGNLNDGINDTANRMRRLK